MANNNNAGSPGRADRVEPSPIDLINHCLQHTPGSLGLLFLSHRATQIHFKKLPLKPSTCRHQPAGGGSIVSCDCGQSHYLTEKCTLCDEWIGYHDFKGRERRSAVIEFELPERVGVNLQLPADERDFFFAFSVERKAYDELVEKMNSRIIQPA